MLGTCGDVSDLSYINVRLYFGSNWINNHYPQAYRVIVVVEFLLALAMLKTSHPPGLLEARRRLQVRIVALLNLLILAGMIALTFFLHDTYEKKIRDFEQSFVAAGGHSLLRHLYRRAEPFFGMDVDLNRPFPFGDPEQERRIMLRVIASSIPGYLRCRVFCYYDEGRWTVPEHYQPISLVPEEPEGILAMIRYRREDRQAHLENRFDLYFSSALHSDKLLLPSPYARIDLIADNLSADADGQVAPTKWKKDAGYVVYTSADWQPGQAFDLPNGEQLLTKQYLQLPKTLKPELERIAQQIPGLNEKVPDVLFCAGLMQYFHRNFSYSLGPFREEKQDFRNDGRRGAGNLRQRLRNGNGKACLSPCLA